MPDLPTHCFVAQRVRVLGRLDDRYLVQFPDGSVGWHDGPLVPIEAVEREALN